MSEPMWNQVRGYVRDAMAEHLIPAVALAVGSAGKEVFAEGFGVRDVDSRGDVGPDTIFGVASVSKSFTALAVMQLAEAGKLSIDDPVVRHLPAYRTADSVATNATTLQHFLTHTAGLPPLPSRSFALAPATAGDPYAAPRPPWIGDHPPLRDADDLLGYIADLDVTPLGGPGERYSYSNEGFALLGAIVERVSGQRFVDYVQQHILDPIGMLGTTYDRTSLAGDGDLATLHVEREIDGARTILAAPQATYPPLWYPAGGVNSTARELLRYMEVYRAQGVSHGVRLLSEAGVARMLTPHAATGEPGANYGYGLRIRPDFRGRALIQHGGGSKGISSHVLTVPDLGYSAVALTNLADRPADRIALAPLNSLIGLPVDRPFVDYPSVPCSADRLARWAGTYRGDEGTVIHAAPQGDRLTLHIDDQDFDGRPVGEDGVVVVRPTGEAFARFLLTDPGPAWAISFGGRILRRLPESAA